MKETHISYETACSFSCCFGLALGAFMGYQLHEQTTPAAEVAALSHSNANKIAQIEAWLEKYRGRATVILPSSSTVVSRPMGGMNCRIIRTENRPPVVSQYIECR